MYYLKNVRVKMSEIKNICRAVHSVVVVQLANVFNLSSSTSMHDKYLREVK